MSGLSGGRGPALRRAPSDPTEVTVAEGRCLRELLTRDGYCTVPGIFGPGLLAELRSVTGELIDRMSEDEQQRWRLQGSLISAWDHPALGKAAAIQVLHRLGFANPKFMSGYIISKPPEMAPPLFWHQDAFSWDEPISYTDEVVQLFLMYYLIDTSPANGCLRVIPGSHRKRHELHGLGSFENEEIQQAEEGHPALDSHPDEVDVAVQAGDLVIGDYRLLHSAHANGSSDRRTCLTLWYCPRYDELPESLQAVYGKRGNRPETWSDEEWSRVAPLVPVYEGEAEPATHNRVPGPKLT